MSRRLLKLLPTAWLALGWGIGLSGASPTSVRAAEGDAPVRSAPPAALAESPRQEPPPKDGLPPDPLVIQRLRARGIEAKHGGTVGRHLRLWLLEIPHQRPALVMTTAEGHLIRGQIYDAEGHRVIDTDATPPLVMDPTRRREEGLAPLTGGPAAEAASASASAPNGGRTGGSVWDQLGQASVIEEGRAGAPLVYIFFDPYCRYCHQQWWTLRTKVAGGHLQVRWVPVAVLSRSQSHWDVVRGLLRDPRAETLAGWMQNQRVKPDDGETTQAALARNRVLFQALKVPSVPALIYKDSTGRLVTRVGVTPL